MEGLGTKVLVEEFVGTKGYFPRLLLQSFLFWRERKIDSHHSPSFGLLSFHI